MIGGSSGATRPSTSAEIISDTPQRLITTPTIVRTPVMGESAAPALNANPVPDSDFITPIRNCQVRPLSKPRVGSDTAAHTLLVCGCILLVGVQRVNQPDVSRMRVVRRRFRMPEVPVYKGILLSGATAGGRCFGPGSEVLRWSSRKEPLRSRKILRITFVMSD